MHKRLIQLVDLLPGLAAVVLVVRLVQLWAARVPYPYDLEWMEGGMLAHSWRLQQGLPLYVAPGPDFIPFVYPPGYAALVASLGSVFGLTLPLGRVVSLVATAMAASALLFGVFRQTKSWRLGVLASVVFLGTYPASGAFYDLVRPDALYTALLGWALVVGLEERRGAPALAGLLLATAFVMKHNAAAFGVPIALGLLYRDGWRNALQFALVAMIPAGLLTVWLQVSSHGHFLTYLLEVPTSHPRIWGRVLPGAFRDMGSTLPVATGILGLWAILSHSDRVSKLSEGWRISVPVASGVALAWYGYTLGDPGAGTYHFGASFAFFGAGAAAASVLLFAMLGDQRPSWRWVYGGGVLSTALVMAALMRAHNGGFLNVYMQLHWIIAFGFAAALADWRQSKQGWVTLATGVLAAMQIGWQLGRLDYGKLAPTAADRAAGDAFVEAIRDVEGPVLSPFASWLPVYAGKAPSVHLIALWDLNYKGGPYYQDVEMIRAAVRDHYWGAVIDGSKPLAYGVPKAYMKAETPKVEEGALAPKMGWPAHPAQILLPRPEK